MIIIVDDRDTVTDAYRLSFDRKESQRPGSRREISKAGSRPPQSPTSGLRSQSTEEFLHFRTLTQLVGFRHSTVPPSAQNQFRRHGIDVF